MPILSHSMEEGGKEEESYKYKISHYAITDVVDNEADDEWGMKGWDCLIPMNVHIAAQSYWRRGANSPY